MAYFDYILGFDPRNQKATKKKPRFKPQRITIAHTEHFHRNKDRIPRIIRGTIGKHEIIYGEHSLKAHFPQYLKRHTQDYDVYSPTPYKDAKQTEKALDREFMGDYFYTKKAEHPGTFKVIAHANDEGYADYTKKPRNTPYDKINGFKYAKLSLEKEHRIRSLKDPEYRFRHAKDRDGLNRIKIFEKKHKWWG